MPKTRKKKGTEGGGILYGLIQRSTLFLLLFLAAMLLLYVSGNFQSLLDSSLRIILFCASLSSAMLFPFSCAGFLASLAMLAARRRPGLLLGALAYLLAAAAAAAAFVSLRGIAVLTAGIR